MGQKYVDTGSNDVDFFPPFYQKCFGGLMVLSVPSAHHITGDGTLRTKFPVPVL